MTTSTKRTNMGKTAALKKTPAAALAAAFAIPALAKGEAYAGVLLDADGTPSHHLVLLPGKKADVNWKDAKAWAKDQGGELPTRKEQALLFANAAQHFEPRFYWSGEQHAEFGDYAWGANFGDGYQNDDSKGDEFRARAVRRVPIR